MKTKKEIRRSLWDSLELSVLRRDFLLLGLIGLAYMSLAACQSGSAYRASPMAYWIVIWIVIAPFLAFYLWRGWMIFRKPEFYKFYRCTLSAPHQRLLTQTMYFTVILEDEGGKQLVDTHAIFACHGLVGPLMEDYVNRTVTIAYNDETDMVVVIG